MEGHWFHHPPLGCCLPLWTSSVQFTGKAFWKTPNTHSMGKQSWTISSFVVEFIVLALRKYLESSSLTQCFKRSSGRNPSTSSYWRQTLSLWLPVCGWPPRVCPHLTQPPGESLQGAKLSLPGASGYAVYFTISSLTLSAPKFYQGWGLTLNEVLCLQL